MFEVGKEYRFCPNGEISNDYQPKECVFAGNRIVVFRDCEGREDVTARNCYCNYKEYHKPVIEHRFASIKFFDVPPCAVAVYIGPKYRHEDNVKFTFTDGKLTEVKII